MTDTDKNTQPAQPDSSGPTLTEFGGRIAAGTALDKAVTTKLMPEAVKIAGSKFTKVAAEAALKTAGKEVGEATLKQGFKGIVGGNLASEALMGGWDQYNIARENAFNRNEKHGEALIESATSAAGGAVGAAAATAGATALLGAATVASGGTVWIVIGAGVVGGLAAHYTKEGVKYASDFHSVSDSMFQPTAQMTHMVGLASQKFRNELAGPDGTINWGDIATLEKYDVLLEPELKKRQDAFRKVNHFMPRWVSQMWDPEGVAHQEDLRSDERIASSAKEELKVQMEVVRDFQKQNAEFNVAMQKLAAPGSNVVSFDRDGDGIITQADKDEIEKILGPEMMKKVFDRLGEPKLGTAIAEVAPAKTTDPTPTRMSSNSSTLALALNQLFKNIGSWMSSTGSAVMAFFSGSKPSPTNNIAAAPVTNHPRSDTPDSAQPSPGNVPQPVTSKQTGKA